jgi:hypothetical protein
VPLERGTRIGDKRIYTSERQRPSPTGGAEKGGAVDTDNETAKFKFILFVVVAFLVSTFFAYMELKYSMSGKTTQGTVDRLGEVRGRRGRTTPMVYYHYRDEAGNLRHGSSSIDGGFNADVGDKVGIQYLDDTSRLAGSRNTMSLIVFFGSLVALVVGGFMFWRHVREATRPSKPYTVPKRF